MNKVLQYTILINLFLILCLPLVVFNDLFFPFITGKGFAFRIIVGVTFASWLILTLRDTSVRPKGSALLFAFALFVFSLGVSTFLSENPYKSFWSNFERMDGWISLVHQFVYFLVLTSMLQTKKMWRAFWNTSIGVSTVIGVYGLFQLFGLLQIHQGGVRVDATFGNATYLAVYMLFHAFITLVALTSWTKERWLQALYGFAFVLQIIIIFYTATRGTILGLIGGLLLSALIIVFFGKNQAKTRKWGIGVLIAIFILIGGFFAVKDTAFVRDNDVLTRIASISLSEGSTRFTVWSMALKGALERPIFGWGQESFNYIFNKNYQPSLHSQEPWFDRAHNQFLDWLVAGGIVGLTLYLALYGFALRYLWRKQSIRSEVTDDGVFTLTERALLTGLLAAYAFHNLFVFDNLISSILFLSVIGYIVVKSGRGKPFPSGAGSMSEPIRWALSGVIVLIFIPVFYFTNVPSLVRAHTLIEAIKPHQEGLSKNFEYYKSSIEGFGTGLQEAHEQLLQFAFKIRGQNISALSSDEFKQETAIFAAQKFNEEIDKAPNDTRLRIFFASFLHQLGDLTNAKAEALRALELSPKKQSILFELGAIAQDSGNLGEALDWFRQAFELEPSYDTARVYYAATAIRLGQTSLADSLLNEGFGTAAPDNGIILQAYLDVGNLSRVLEIAQTRVERNPEDAQKQLELASVYLQLGRRSDAINAIREAIRLEPSFKDEGERYISDIEAGNL